MRKGQARAEPGRGGNPRVAGTEVGGREVGALGALGGRQVPRRARE